MGSQTARKASYKIGPTPEEAARADYLPYELTQSELTGAAKASAHLEQLRRERNRLDDSRALGGVLWMEER